MKRLLGIMVAGLVVLLVATGCGDKEVSNEKFEDVLGDGQAIRELVEIRNLRQIKVDMHHLSHEVIRANEKWGSKDMFLENINKLILELSEVRTPDYRNREIKANLMDILNTWRNGDFSEADEHHNYIWNLQGCTIGRATGVKPVSAWPDWSFERRQAALREDD